MKEGEAKQRCQQRAAAQRAAAAASTGSPQAGAAAPAGGGAVPRSSGSFMGGGLRMMSERMPGFSGPDVSSWFAVWGSVMGSTLGHQAMPLLQVRSASHARGVAPCGCEAAKTLMISRSAPSPLRPYSCTAS